MYHVKLNAFHTKLDTTSRQIEHSSKQPYRFSIQTELPPKTNLFHNKIKTLHKVTIQNLLFKESFKILL